MYTCTLTMEPFRDPVVTPDGNSFERTALMDHLKKACLHPSVCHEMCLIGC